jgi:stress-induced morphogen
MDPPQALTSEVTEALHAAIVKQLPDAQVRIEAHGGGHFSVSVTSASFRGRSMLESHRLVYGAIAPLLAGADAPVHAIDSLRTKAP